MAQGHDVDAVNPGDTSEPDINAAPVEGAPDVDPVDGAYYIDPADGTRYPIDQPRWRGDTGLPLMVSPQPGITRDRIDVAARGLWRYRAALPVAVDAPITLGEGGTPLVPMPWLGEGSHAKLEWFSPTGSFKDRGASVMLSVLRAQGVTRVFEDSSGNGGAAVAAYGAAGGMEVTVFAPASTSPAKLVQSREYGARIELVPGPREASQEAAIAAAHERGGFYASHNWQPFFLEGVKTLAYELWEDLGFRAPDAVVTPVGAGSSLLGLALGFRELQRAGEITRLPRLYAAQPRNCSPVDAAFRGEADRPVRPTIAEGTAIRSPLRLAQMLEALHETGGGTVAISESGITASHTRLARHGLYAEPTSATAAAAAEQLLATGEISPDETSVVVLTGSGLKSPRRPHRTA